MQQRGAHRTKTGRKALLGSAFAVVVGLGSTLTVVAQAAENEVYDQAQLLAACNEKTDIYGKADRCRKPVRRPRRRRLSPGSHQLRGPFTEPGERSPSQVSNTAVNG